MGLPSVVGVQRLALLPEERARALLERAVAGGVRWLDTADVYGARPGDAERLLAPFVGRTGIVTKGGLVRDGPRWRPDGRASHLESACLGSADRLGVDTIDRYLLHAPDPATDLRVSARALARLVARGVVREVGVCNVGVGQLAAVRAEVPVACVEVEVSRLVPAAVRSGVVETCLAEGIELWAHRPFGGADRARKALADPAAVAVAARHGVPPGAVVLAWLADLGLVPVPGPSREETLDACLVPVPLDDADRSALDAGAEAATQLRRPRALRAPPPGDREVRIVMGTPGAGKSSRAVTFEGFARLNRDERGGRLADLVPALDRLLAEGASRVVLDNTYASRASRNPVIETAWKHGVAVTCEWLDTPPDEAEVNAVDRILDVLGRLPEPAEFDRLGERQPAILPPRALSRFRAELEPPVTEEGLSRITVVPFVRRPSAGGGRAVLLDPRDLVPDERLRAEAAAGATLLVVGWEPGGTASAIEERARVLDLPVHAAICPHPPGPPICWCRKPLPGLARLLLRRHGCDPARSVAWGTSAADRALARKLGVPLLA